VSSLVEVYLLKSVEYEALAAATLDQAMRVQYQRLAQQWRGLATDAKHCKEVPGSITDKPSGDKAQSMGQESLSGPGVSLQGTGKS
jgi:hypothetical protein